MRNKGVISKVKITMIIKSNGILKTMAYQPPYGLTLHSYVLKDIFFGI
jgi:hypothetical protein